MISKKEGAKVRKRAAVVNRGVNLPMAWYGYLELLAG
jgi:hypothetical protein